MVLFGCADRLILFPTRQPISGLAAKPLIVAGPVGKLEIWKMPSLGAVAHRPKAYVLTFVGNASRAEWDAEQVAEQWNDLPVEVWAVNYPGYGQSEGSAKLSSIAPASVAAFDALKQQAGDKPIFVAGRSIGTAAALYVAAHRPVSGVILHSPPPLRSLIMGRFGWWNLWLAAIPVSLSVPADLDSIANARHSTVPAIFIVTGGDTLVPPEYQQKVIDAYAGPKQLIVMPGVDHNDSIPGPALAELRKKLGQLLKGR
ncbi:MAG TPA: alpha/beta fold hydrolase [Tepidisphaeraceae bacterium]|jgi:hypothetical protein|nr:alpha/beta fold hydrolase [Tepidisphaeraceae bacterium]